MARAKLTSASNSGVRFGVGVGIGGFKSMTESVSVLESVFGGSGGFSGFGGFNSNGGIGGYGGIGTASSSLTGYCTRVDGATSSPSP